MRRQQGDLDLRRVPERLGLPLGRLPRDDDVTQERRRRIPGREGEDIGDVVFTGEAGIQPAQLPVPRETNVG